MWARYGLCGLQCGLVADCYGHRTERAAIVKAGSYKYAPHNDVSVNDGPHIRRWSDTYSLHGAESFLRS